MSGEPAGAQGGEPAAGPPPPARLRRIGPAFAAAALVALAALLVFARTLGFPFVCWDDGPNVYQNPHFNPAVTAAGIAAFWRQPYNDLYTPLTDTVWALLALVARLPQPVLVLGGDRTTLNAGVYHAAGVLAHAASAALVFLLLRSLLRACPRASAGAAAADTTLPAALGALLFAVHPLQVEPVAWVTGHNNVYGGLFTFAALLLYVRGALSGARRPGVGFALATVAYVLALLCKPTAVAAPLLAAALDALVLRRPARRWLPGVLLWAALGAVCLAVTRSSSGNSVGVDVPLAARPLIALDAAAFYLYKLIWPLPLTIDYGRTPEHVLAHGWSWANAAAVVALFAGLAVLARRGLRWPLAALLLFVLGALPTMGLVPFYFERYSTVADRYLYVSLLGPALAVAFLLAGAAKRWRPPLCAAAGLAAVLLGARSIAQTSVWRDSVALFEQATRQNPLSPPLWHNLAGSLLTRQQPGDLEAAERAEREALRLRPKYAAAHFELGEILQIAGRPAEAADEFTAATRDNPEMHTAWFALGVSLAKLGRTAEALPAMARAARMESDNDEAHYIYGVLLGNAGRLAEAETEFRSAVRLKPDFDQAHYSLGIVLERQGRPGDAVPELQEAVRLSPENPAARAALERARAAAAAASRR